MASRAIPSLHEARTFDAVACGSANASEASRRFRTFQTLQLRRISTEMDSRGLI